jgi:large subunit ribosomal protein L4e
MKIEVLNAEGKKKGEITTEIFSGKIREDVVQKVVETEKVKHPYAPNYLAGKQAAAAGKTKHARRKWRSAAGKGLARVPRKVFWRRGTQFYWQGATIASTRGGRRAHPPRVLSMIKVKKVNKKEREFAFLSALAMTASTKEIKKKYGSLEDTEIKIKFPIIAESEILELKTKDFLKTLRKILDDLFEIAIQKKSIRAGKGKMRGRKYKKTAGLLLVIGKNEEKKIKGIELRKAIELSVSDLASNGARLTIYTEEAVKELGKRLGESVEEKEVKKKKVKRKKKTKRKAKKQKRKAKKVEKKKPAKKEEKPKAKKTVKKEKKK